jgi:hypothetical protein
VTAVYHEALIYIKTLIEGVYKETRKPGRGGERRKKRDEYTMLMPTGLIITGKGLVPFSLPFSWLPGSLEAAGNCVA